jgi:hypothetical protein
MPDYVVPPHPQPFEGSPSKSPIFAAGAIASDDVEFGAKREGAIDFSDVTMPSRNIAMRERRKKQLRTCDKDSFGVPLPNTRRPFSLFASPFSIAEVCTGLGVYLASLQATVLLVLMLSVLCIYPVVDNVKSQRWAEDYSLLTGVRETHCFSLFGFLVPVLFLILVPFFFNLQSGGAVASCPKGWDLTSWLTSTTIGGHCNGGSYTSKYDCAAQCVWSPERLKNSQCKGVKPPGIAMANSTTTSPTKNSNSSTSNTPYKTRLSGQCAQHLPCVKGRVDPSAPDGPCLCCQMQQDPAAIATNPRVSAGQLWTFFLCQLVFLIWMLFLVHTQVKTVHIQGTRVVGASDYSAWISGIARTRTDDAPLAHWCGQFGSVVSAFNVPNVGDALRVGREVATLQIKKAESDALSGSTSCNPLQWIYGRFVVGKPKGLEESLEKKQRKLAIYERQESEPTGQGLVTFEFTESAASAITAFERLPLRSLLDKVSLGFTDTTPRLHGTVVKVVRAPEPSDVLWEHTNCTGTPALLRRIWSWTITALIILAGAGIQYGFAVAAERLREDRMMAQYAAGTGAEWAVAEAAAKTKKLRAVSVVSAVVVVTINLTIMLTMRALSWYERWTTRTSMERWVMLKLSVSQLCNAFAAPMLAAYASGNRSGWFSRGGLMDAAFYIMCANSLVPPLFHLLGLGDKIKYYILSPFARTQPMLNQLLAPPLFPMAEQYAASVTTLGLALWYMPVLPMSPMIALVGLSISYCSNKWVAVRRAAAPPNLSGMVTAPLNWLLRLLPLVQMILMKQLYFKDYPTIDPVFYTGLAFWTLFCLAPIRALLGAVRRRRRQNASSGLSYHRLLGGKRLGVGDVYAPLVPKPCSRKFKERVASTFAQLAPAAFETILNGEEVAKFLFGGNGGDIQGDKDRLAAFGITSADLKEFNLGGADGRPQQGQSQGISLRASIAAGVRLLWQPQDPDHPDDVFMPAAADVGSSGTHGLSSGGRTVEPTAPPSRPCSNDNSNGRPNSGSTSDSCDPNGGGGAGGDANVATPAAAVTPPIMTRHAVPCTTTPGSNALIPAVRHRNTNGISPDQGQRRPAAVQGRPTPNTTGRGHGPSRLGPSSRRATAAITGTPGLDNFRPLGSGLPAYFFGDAL